MAAIRQSMPAYADITKNKNNKSQAKANKPKNRGVPYLIP